MKFEKENKFKDAIEQYLVALEALTYEVKLPLGRAEILRKNNEKGKNILKEFISETEAEINNEDKIGVLTEEGKKELNYKISLANRLIDAF